MLLAASGLAAGAAADENRPASRPVPAGQPASRPAHLPLYLDAADIAFLRQRIAEGADPWADEFALLGARLKRMEQKAKGLAPSLDAKSAGAGGPRRFRGARPLDARRPEAVGGDLSLLLRDGQLARDLALRYRLADRPDEADARAAARILLAWPACIEPRVTGEREAMDLAVGLPALLYAADLLWDSPAFDAAARRPFLDWVLAAAGGVRDQYRVHVGYRSRSAGFGQAAWSRHLALAVGTLTGDQPLAAWAVLGDGRSGDAFARLLEGSFDAQGRPLQEASLARCVFSVEPLVLMSLIRRDAGGSAALGLDAAGRAGAMLRRVGRFLCGEVHWPGAQAEVSLDAKGRPMLPIVFPEAVCFVPLTAGGEGLGAMAHRVLRHNPRLRPGADGKPVEAARVEPWVLGPVFLTHYRPPAPAPQTRPAGAPADG